MLVSDSSGLRNPDVRLTLGEQILMLVSDGSGLRNLDVRLALREQARLE